MTGSRIARPWAALVLPLLLAACGDPFSEPGTWHPAGLNDANLAVMVRDKQDLFRGQEQPGSDGQLAADAIERLRQDKPRHLPIESTSSQSGTGP